MNLKGSLPLLILVILSRGPCHGYQIARAIKQQSDGVLDFKEGTLYPTLHGLEAQGLVESFTVEEGGRTRRYYRLTESGQGELERQLAHWARFTEAVNLVLKGAES